MDSKFRVGTVAAFVVCAGAAGAAQAHAFSTGSLQARSHAEFIRPIPNALGLFALADRKTSQGTNDRVQQVHFFYPDPSLYLGDPWVMREYHPQSYHYHRPHHDHRHHHRSQPA